MMNGGSSSMEQENVGIDRIFWDVPVMVELRVYLRFSRRMDSRPRRLEHRYANGGAPSRQLAESGWESGTK